MLDIKKIRENAKEIEKKLKTKDPDIEIGPLLKLDKEIRDKQKESDLLKAKKNKISKEIGLKKEKLPEIQQQMKKISEKISFLDKEIKNLEEQRKEKLSLLPNIPNDNVPISLDPKDNVCIKTFKEKKEFDFPIKNHLQLNEKLKLFDFEKAVKIAKSGFCLYKNLGARLEWALLNYMLDTHIKNGFIQIIPPLICKEDTMFGSGQLPKFENDLFKIKNEDHNFYLIPTSEVVLNGMWQNSIIEEEKLPLKYVSFTPCFRKEAGAAGKNERGLIRTHQFNKVELFAFSLPEKSEQMFEIILNSAEEVLQGLNLHYRNMLLVTKDTSFASAKTVDVEVWLPGQNRYYEVSSISNCTDFQARRSSIKYRKKREKPQFLHTLNGSGLATSRLLIAILENNQQEDGSIKIPKVLHKYLEEEITILK